MRAALRRGQSVVVDRMHLSAEQRSHFVTIGREACVPIDALLLLPPLAEMQRRVTERVGHPGGVMGAAGARLVPKSYAQIVPPAYSEGFSLISRVETPSQVASLARLYQRTVHAPTAHGAPLVPLPLPPPPLPSAFELRDGSCLPAIALGTMQLKGYSLGAMLREGGFSAVDTSQGYENEAAVGAALPGSAYLICKVPHKAFKAADVRKALGSSLSRLGRRACDLLLLHWPHNALEHGTLGEVWGAMEAAAAAGECRALGVCNFSVVALEQLLSLRPDRLPAVNQVERHPLLPQWELLDFCSRHHIVLQAHTPLGQGKPALLENAVLRRVSAASGLTTAQVCLQWNLRHGVAVVPKCSGAPHAAEIHAAGTTTTTTTTTPRLAEGGGADALPRGVLSPEHMRWLDALRAPGTGGTRFIRGPPPGAKAHLYSW